MNPKLRTFLDGPTFFGEGLKVSGLGFTGGYRGYTLCRKYVRMTQYDPGMFSTTLSGFYVT